MKIYIGNAIMFWSRNNPTGHAIDVDYTPTKGGRTNIDFFIKRDVRFDDTIESFRYTFFLDNRNLQTARKHVTNVQRSGYTSAVHVFPAWTACWGKWTTASFLCKFYLTNPRWGCKCLLFMSVVLESQRFWIEHWRTCQFLVNTYER